MRCSESQTICTARDPRPAVAGAFEALMFERVLQPLVRALGPVGELALGTVAQRVFIPPK